MKKTLVYSCLLVFFSGIAMLFWFNEYRYSLPTPVPENYAVVHVGSVIDLEGKIKQARSKPLFIHFFNPSCPCSRFNIPHFRSLVKQFGSSVNFMIVVLSNHASYTESEIQNKFELTIPVLFDKSIAVSCGVYSTPQAAILDADHKLYYRGNYNKSRYCTNPNSDFAKMALDSLVKKNSAPTFSALATLAYGCQLPACKK